MLAMTRVFTLHWRFNLFVGILRFGGVRRLRWFIGGRFNVVGFSSLSLKLHNIYKFTQINRSLTFTRFPLKQTQNLEIVKMKHIFFPNSSLPDVVELWYFRLWIMYVRSNSSSLKYKRFNYDAICILWYRARFET